MNQFYFIHKKPNSKKYSNAAKAQGTSSSLLLYQHSAEKTYLII